MLHFKIKKIPKLAYFSLATILRLWRCCMRFKLDDSHKIYNSNEPLIFVNWHNKLLFFQTLLKKDMLSRINAMISMSRDGEYISELLAQFNVKSIRGSSSKRSAAVLIEAIKILRKTKNIVAITPDGPRGPIYSMNPGAILLASKTGVPIVPLSSNASSYWKLNSWDKFQIPKPWCKITLKFGEKIHIPPKLDEDGIKYWSNLVREKLLEVSECQKEKE